MKEILQLLRQRAEIEQQLAAFDIIRNANNPIADIGEYVAARVLGGNLSANNATGHDVIMSDGKKVEVKTRRLRQNFSASETFGVLREPFHFDGVVFIVFNMDYTIASFTYINRDDLAGVVSWNNRNTGWAANVRRVQGADQGHDCTAGARRVWGV